MDARSHSRATILSVFVGISLIVPIAIIYYASRFGLPDRPFGAMSREYKWLTAGSIKNGELWYPVVVFPDNLWAIGKRFRVKRLNLETGIEREAESTNIIDSWGKLFWIGDDLYFYGTTSVFQLIGDRFVTLGKARAAGTSIFCDPFPFDGQMTIVELTGSGGYRLVHWNGDEWIEGREIRLPQIGCVWYDDPQRGRRVVLPRTSEQPKTTTALPTGLNLEVRQRGQQLHLLYYAFRTGFYAYRNGFEFADEDDAKTLSALAPENAPCDVTGWEQIPLSMTEDCYLEMVCSKDALYFVSKFDFSGWGPPNKFRFFRKTGDGPAVELEIEDENAALQFQYRGTGSTIVADPSSSQTYVVRSNRWSGYSISRVEGNRVRPAHIISPGREREYLAYWYRLAAGVAFAWLAHLAILLIGADWLIRTARPPIYEFGMQSALLPSLSRRCLAFALDIVCVLIVCWVCMRLGFGLPLFQIELPSQIQLADYLYEIEEHLFYSSQGGRWDRAVFQLFMTLQSTLWKLSGQFYAILFASIACLELIKFVVDGRFGVTPGKWLLGMRTLQTTLRPQGFARSLARDIVTTVDFPLLLTPLPGIMSMIFSENRQRLGDRVADTVVIRKMDGLVKCRLN